MKNCPRIKSFTNTRIAGGAFVHSWSIRGWLLGAKVNALRELQSAGGEELSLRDASRSVLEPSVLDRAFKGEL
ncbi:MAG: hypothetical protein FJZ87_07855 [Chloroflexi bacterium]|nr:hypothetical protein [Chloroflexota bacterium]